MSPLVKSCTVTEGWTDYFVCSIHKQPKMETNLSDKLDNKSQWKSVKINNIPDWMQSRQWLQQFRPCLTRFWTNFWTEEFLTCATCLHNSLQILLQYCLWTRVCTNFCSSYHHVTRLQAFTAHTEQKLALFRLTHPQSSLIISIWRGRLEQAL